MPEVIRREEPAIMACHWPGIYCGGRLQGFRIFQETVRRLHSAFDNLIWMKLSEISRYWAARELTAWQGGPDGVVFQAPFACPGFTMRLPGVGSSPPAIEVNGKSAELREAKGLLELRSGTWARLGEGVVVCFDLPKGRSKLVASGGAAQQKEKSGDLWAASRM
jgi:hypothetical protein